LDIYIGKGYKKGRVCAGLIGSGEEWLPCMGHYRKNRLVGEPFGANLVGGLLGAS